MFDFSWGKRFGLSKGAVACDRDGLFVGSVPLLQRELWFGSLVRWAARPAADIERDLGFCYGLPIDVSGKAGGLAAVTNALNRGDLFAASVAALHLEFPDPPRFAKGAWPEGALLKLAGELWRSGLLKDWDSDKHPRTGTKPNPGRFANKPPEEPRELTITRGPSRSRWPSKMINKLVRKWALETAEKVAERGALGPFVGLEVAIEVFLKVMKPLGLNDGEDLVTAQLRANFDPRLKHEKISSDYSSTDQADPQERTLRDVVKDMDFDEQRAAGLAELRKYGVLK